ncbi:unnamed protein product [Bursaphelenchus okinawaensis]|uniref:Uncharacterized protein n=1 Tax=Bursaphelenchus okinawaensis TaxID=465554 RepID=A0A811KS70_9BILA|nr:unnamed protein product [Bursaphelenchus okinawaensis]CAG9109534.1 unnamed protein product [Bursaphelenchus okinawaensis]
MNAFLHIQKFLRRRRAKRLREQQNLLYSLNLPSSFPCLIEPHLEERCCQHSPHSIVREMQIIHAPEPLPSYSQAVITALRPSWTPPVENSTSEEPLPPTYSVTCLNETLEPSEDLNNNINGGDTDSLLNRMPCEEGAPPAYDQIEIERQLDLNLIDSSAQAAKGPNRARAQFENLQPAPEVGMQAAGHPNVPDAGSQAAKNHNEARAQVTNEQIQNDLQTASTPEARTHVSTDCEANAQAANDQIESRAQNA